MNAAYKYDILSKHNNYDVSISEGIRNDPFGLGNAVKGLTNMNHERYLSNYAEELVARYAKYEYDTYTLNFNDLPDEEQSELTRLFMESTDRETSECVYGNDFSINNDFTCALLAMLQDDCEETREKFAEVTRKNIIIYYEKSLQEVINEACNYYIHSIHNESGYSYECDQTGETQWSSYK